MLLEREHNNKINLSKSNSIMPSNEDLLSISIPLYMLAILEVLETIVDVCRGFSMLIKSFTSLFIAKICRMCKLF